MLRSCKPSFWRYVEIPGWNVLGHVWTTVPGVSMRWVFVVPNAL